MRLLPPISWPPYQRKLAIALIAAATMPAIGSRGFAEDREAPSAPGASVADTNPSTAPSNASVNTDRLEELSREVRELYQSVAGSLVRVQLPAPQWANRGQLAPLDKYQQLDPQMRARIAEQQAYSNVNAPPSRSDGDVPQPQNAQGPRASTDASQQAGSSPSPAATPSTQPETRPDGSAAPGQISEHGNLIVVRPPPDSGAMSQQRPNFIGGHLELKVMVSPQFAPNNVGIVIDDDGHVLLPIYVERETCANQLIHLAGPGGSVVEARFIGSDRPTNLSVLQLLKPAGRPARLGGDRPDDGSIVLFLSPSDGSGHIGLWTGAPNDSGIVLSTDGRIAGIARNGQFLTGSACRLISDLLIRNGSVRRATLGVIITQLPKNDPVRHLGPLANGEGAMRIDMVIAGSAADRAGLKTGDLLLAVGGQPVIDISSFAALIAGRDGKTSLEVLRDEKPLTVDVELHPGK